MELLVAPGGLIRCVYAEEVDLSALGALEIRRASFVEPDPQGRWWADLSPVAGPVLGPFPGRSHALSAEVSWLKSHWLRADPISLCSFRSSPFQEYPACDPFDPSSSST